jgi:hypothetical protein
VGELERVAGDLIGGFRKSFQDGMSPISQAQTVDERSSIYHMTCAPSVATFVGMPFIMK